jgi:hypothetical protein
MTDAMDPLAYSAQRAHPAKSDDLTGAPVAGVDLSPFSGSTALLSTPFFGGA